MHDGLGSCRLWLRFLGSDLMRDKTSHFISEQTMKFRRGHIGRRAFISSMLSAGVTVPTAMGMVSKVQAATPQRGGVFRVAIEGNRDELGRHLAFLTGNALTVILPGGAVAGDLAQTLEPDGTGTDWHVKLRRDVLFHSGKALTPEDVVLSLAPHMAPGGALGCVEDLVVKGTDGLTFKTEPGSYNLPRLLADPLLTIRPGGASTPDGTGPYKLAETAPGLLLRAVRNEDYIHAGRAHFDACELRIEPDPTRRQNALINADLDAIDGIDPSAVGFLKRAPNVQVQDVPDAVQFVFRLMTSTPDVRAAVSCCLDGPGLVRDIFLGLGSSPERPEPMGNAHSVRHLNMALPNPLPRAMSGVADHVIARAAAEGIGIAITPVNRADIVADMRWGEGQSDDPSLVVAATAHALNGLSTRVQTSETLARNGNFDGYKAYERWWFTA